MARLYWRDTRDGGRWYAYVPKSGGGTRLVSTRCTDKRAAEKRAAELEREAVDPTYAASHAATTAELCDLFLKHKIRGGAAQATVKFYRTKLGHVVRIMPALLVQSGALTAKEAYADQRAREGADATTVAKELRSWETALRYAKRKKLWRGDLAEERLEFKDTYKPRKRALTPWELAGLCAYFRGHEYISGKGARRHVAEPAKAATVAFIVATGARWGEAMRARREDVFDTHTHLRGSKTEASSRDVPRGVEPFESILVWALDHAEQGSLHLFPRWTNVIRDLETACAAIGIVKCTPNDLRRTFSRWLRTAGVETSLIGSAMGHTTSRMVERVYGRLTTDELGTLLRDRMAPALPAPKPSVDELVRGLLAEHTFEAVAEAIARVRNVSGDSAETVHSGCLLTEADPHESAGFEVPRDGIEPPTRGFSSRPESPGTLEESANSAASCEDSVNDSDEPPPPRGDFQGCALCCVERADWWGVVSGPSGDLTVCPDCLGLPERIEDGRPPSAGGGAAMPPAGESPASDDSPKEKGPSGFGRVRSKGERSRSEIGAASPGQSGTRHGVRTPATGGLSASPVARSLPRWALAATGAFLGLAHARGIEVSP